MPIPLPSVHCARAVRDGGIDAMAALNEALREALVGVTSDQADALKLAFGNVMADLIDVVINPTMKAFPELEVDEAAWVAIAKERARVRASSV